MKRNTLIVPVLVLSLVALTGLVFASNKADSTNEPIKIGAILPMTGELAFIGEEMKKGMELAVAEVTDLNISLIIEDDETFVSKVSVNALNKLVKTDNVDVVLNGAVNTMKALDPILLTEKVPGIVVWDDTNEISEMSEYSHSVGFSTELAGQDMARFAYEELGARNASVVSAIDAWSEIISESFVAEFEKLGGTIDVRERTVVGNSDFRTVSSKVKQAKSDVVYIPQYTPFDIDKLVKQLRDIGYDGEILSADSFSDVNVASLGNYAEGIYFTQLWLQDKNFLEKYKLAYGTETNPINLGFAGLGYDSAKLVIEIARDLESRGEEVNSESIKNRLVGFKLEGVTGKTEISKDRTTEKREPILVVKNSTLEVVKSY